MKGFMRAGLALVLLSAAVPAGADTIFYLDETNSSTLTGGPWASVTLSDTTSASGQDGVHFVVNPIDSAFASADTNFGIQTFYFNDTSGFGSELSVENFNPDGWTYSYDSDPTYNAGGGFGKFEFFDAGSGATRGNPLSFDVYAPVGESLTIEDLSTGVSTEGYIFSAHIADFNGGDSAKFGTDGPAVPTNPVPEPGTILLLGSGILGLGLRRRKIKTV